MSALIKGKKHHASFPLNYSRRFSYSSPQLEIIFLVPRGGKLTLKNREDVKKSCMRGSNRSCRISEEKEEAGGQSFYQLSRVQFLVCDTVRQVSLKLKKWRARPGCVCLLDRIAHKDEGGDGDKNQRKLTGAGDNGDVAQQAKNLWTEEGTVPHVEEFVEKSLWTGKALLGEKSDTF